MKKKLNSLWPVMSRDLLCLFVSCLAVFSVFAVGLHHEITIWTSSAIVDLDVHEILTPCGVLIVRGFKDGAGEWNVAVLIEDGLQLGN